MLSLLDSHTGLGAAGLQAILPDALLMAVAAARPSSASALVAFAKKTLKKLNRDTAQQETYDALPQRVPACLCQQSDQVCNVLQLGCFMCTASYVEQVDTCL